MLVTSNQTFAEIITSCFNILYVLFEHPQAEVSYQFGSTFAFVLSQCKISEMTLRFFKTTQKVCFRVLTKNFYEYFFS